MKVSFEGHSLVVRREKGDPRIRGGTWGTSESHLLYHVKKALLEQCGIRLIKTRAWRDNHMFGDVHTQILRPPLKRTGILPKAHNICVYDPNYALRDVGRLYMETGLVVLDVMKGYWSHRVE